MDIEQEMMTADGLGAAPIQECEHRVQVIGYTGEAGAITLEPTMAMAFFGREVVVHILTRGGEVYVAEREVTIRRLFVVG